MDITRIIFHQTDQSVHIRRAPLVQFKYYPTRESYTRLVTALDAEKKIRTVEIYTHHDGLPPGWTAMLGYEKDTP